MIRLRATAQEYNQLRTVTAALERQLSAATLHPQQQQAAPTPETASSTRCNHMDEIGRLESDLARERASRDTFESQLNKAMHQHEVDMQIAISKTKASESAFRLLQKDMQRLRDKAIEADFLVRRCVASL